MGSFFRRCELSGRAALQIPGPLIDHSPSHRSAWSPDARHPPCFQKPQQIRTFLRVPKTRSAPVTEKLNFLLLCFPQLGFFLPGFRPSRRLLWDRFRNTGGDKNPNTENDRPDPDSHRPILFSVIKQHPRRATEARLQLKKPRKRTRHCAE